MPARLSRSEGRLTPDPWRYALEAFEEQLEEGVPPDLSPCLRLFKGDLIPLLSELVATYQSYRALHGGSSANAIGELIHANPDMRSQISRAVGELSTAQLETPSTGEEKEGELPRRVGGYLLVGNLGVGGFSEVYLGCSPSRAEFVVIKIARTDIEWSDVARESLHQEKLALIQLQGLKGTPEFVDWDDDSEGSVALVTKFVDAQPLDRVCEAENPSVERIVKWMIHLCNILKSAHGLGVHHCDLKPQNILIDAQNDQPIVIDFGLSQSVLRWSRDQLAPARAAGTLHYLAPELLEPEIEADPRRVDAFGLGAVLFYLLSGNAPFQAGNAAEVTARIEDYRINFDLLDRSSSPDRLKSICRQAIAKEPSERTSGPSALQTALLATELVALPTRDWGKTKAIFATVMLISVGVVFFSWYRNTIPQSQKVVAHYAPGILGFNQEEHDSDPNDSLDLLPNKETAMESTWIERVASREGIDLVAIASDSFDVVTHSAMRNAKPWGNRTPSPSWVGTLEIAYDQDLEPIAEALEYRIGDRPWRSMRRSAVAYRYEGDLSARDLEIEEGLEIRIGGRREAVAAGPFMLSIALRDAIADDRTLFRDSLIQEAKSTRCFHPSNSEWKITDRFAKRYAPVLKAFRFGVSLSEPLHKIPGKPYEPETSRWYANLENRGSDLQLWFARECAASQSSPTIWTEIDYVDGSFSGPQRHRRPRLSHSREADAARKYLASLPRKTKVGSFLKYNFRAQILAEIATDLNSIEIGNTRESLSISRPVICDPGLATSRSILKAPHPVLNVESDQPYRIPALYAWEGKLYSGIGLSPTWTRAFFRGRFKDGSVTPVYSVENRFPLVGFQLDYLSAPTGFPPSRAYAFFEIADEGEKGNGISDYYIPTMDTSEEKLALLKRINMLFYADMPSGGTWFTNYTKVSQPLPKNASRFVLDIRIPYLDRYGRLFGSGTFRVHVPEIRRAVDRLIAQVIAKQRLDRDAQANKPISSVRRSSE